MARKYADVVMGDSRPRVRCVIHSASNIRETALFAAQDPYVEVVVMLGSAPVCKARTRAHKSGGKKPVWTLDLDNQITLEIDKSVLEATAAASGAGPVLVFRLMTENVVIADGLIGSAKLPLRTLRDPDNNGQRREYQVDTGGKIDVTTFLPTYAADSRSHGGRHAARRIEHSSLVASPTPTKALPSSSDPFASVRPPPPPGSPPDSEAFGDEEWLENKRSYAAVHVPPECSLDRRQFLMDPLPQTWNDDTNVASSGTTRENSPRARKMVECEITITSRSSDGSASGYSLWLCVGPQGPMGGEIDDVVAGAVSPSRSYQQPEQSSAIAAGRQLLTQRTLLMTATRKSIRIGRGNIPGSGGTKWHVYDRRLGRQGKADGQWRGTGGGTQSRAHRRGERKVALLGKLKVRRKSSFVTPFVICLHTALLHPGRPKVKR
jgi:hypothetical protein